MLGRRAVDSCRRSEGRLGFGFAGFGVRLLLLAGLGFRV